MASIADGGGLRGLDGGGVVLGASLCVSDGVVDPALTGLIFLGEAVSLVAGSKVDGDGDV